MERLRRILHRLLFPGAAAVVLCVLAAAALLAYVFMYAGRDSPVSYAVYVFSFYALTVACVNAVPLVRRGARALRRNRYVGRYLADAPFKLSVSLHGSLAVNLVYAGMNAVSAAFYGSVWFGTLGAYYGFLALLRFLLVRYAHRRGFGSDMVAEWRSCRLCGAILAVMTLALAGVVILLLHGGGGFSYAGSLIYAVALYAFYTVTMAVINVVRYRRYNSPVMSSARAVSLAAASVSMLSLEVAMLEQFGSGDDGSFRTLMTALTGGAVCALIVGMGAYMIIRSSRALRAAREL